MHDVRKNHVTSAELVRSFAKWRDASQTTPIFVTTHGRPSHVLTSARLFQQLTQNSGRENTLLAEEQLTGLADWLGESIILCTADEEIIYANARARQYCRLPALRPGITLAEAMPALEGSVIQVQYRRTMATGEALQADIPSVFAKDCWTHLQSIPLGDRLVLMMRDITDEVEHYRMADAKHAMLDAISLHPDVSYVHITLRGLIEATDPSFRKWMDVSDEKLCGVRLGDLVVRKQRLAFRNALDRVYEDNERQQIEIELMPNKAASLRVKLAIVPLQGAYGLEGASVIMTRVPD
ncbi:PAS domain-containing protein [Aurantiacibacter odishensis]|uniref:PAS domain-containing protein n=1 Tax=Aurantiacibacter odishensis TaxID=1155476 RepID=UPI000E769CCA|nr:PAS domain-containing protein [Aurantiacibacter odishensis]